MKYLKFLEAFIKETFIDWFSNKSGLNIGSEIGKGNWGVVFELDKNRCIKFSNDSIGDIKNLVNKNIPYVVKYYSSGLIHLPKHLRKGTELMIGSFRYHPKRYDPVLTYIIMEKVIIDKIKAEVIYHSMEIQANSVEQYIIDNNLNFTYIPFKELKASDIDRLKAYQIDVINSIKQVGIINYDFNNLLLMLTILINIKMYVPSYFDFIPDQICFDNNGNIKMVDVLSNSNFINRKDIKNIIK